MPKFILTPAEAVGRTRQTDRGFYASLRPVLIGPRAGLHRYESEGEQALLGPYDPLADKVYTYPDRADDSTIDALYTKLYASTLDLNYFNKYVGTNGSAMPSEIYPNRVRAANYVFKSTESAPRSAVFKDRDVQIGDIAFVRGSSGGESYEITTSVTGFEGESLAATTAPVEPDANNAVTQTASADIEQAVGTPINDVVATVDGSFYQSAADGHINRTYTITVTQSSTGGDATTGRLRVRSADNQDNHDNVIPSVFGEPTLIGANGLEVTWDIDTAHSSASLFGIDEDDFVVGQQWVVEVSQAFTAPTATSAGVYTGERSTTYVVAVTRGGPFAGATKPQITVTTTNGYDQSGPTSLTAAATPVAVGNFGVTIAFTGTGLRKGDRYYVNVEAAAEGAIRTLILQNDIPEDIRGTEVDLRLFARRTDLSIPRARAYPSVTQLWSADENTVTVESGIALLDSEFTDNGIPFPVPIEATTLYVEYREWVTDGVSNKVVISNPNEIEANLGTVSPDNPLAYAASTALANTYGELVNDPVRPAADTTDIIFCVALGGNPNDPILWANALEALENEDEAYQLVPLTNDPAIHEMVATHVLAQSAQDVGFFQVAWLPTSLDENDAVVSEETTADGEVVTATITEHPVEVGSYTVVTASANAEFTTNNVRPGDVLRINYGTNEFGDSTFDYYVIESVQSETTVVLQSGPDVPVTVAVMAEVWRNYTKSELVKQLTALAATYASNRVKIVYPDKPSFAGTTLPGYHLCAALAGLAGSVASHQGLRNTGVEGVDDLTRSSRFFNNAQLKELADGGVFVCSQTPDGRPYVAYPHTTDMTSVGTREEMVIRNADMLRKAVQDEWAPYIGTGNITSNIRQLLDGALLTLVNRLKANNSVDPLGPPIANISVAGMRVVPGKPDVLDVLLDVVGLPIPLNQIQVTLPISV